MKYLYLSLLLCLGSNFGYSQLMVNGGFEDVDLSGTVDYYHSIERAFGWDNLVNSCDLLHPDIGSDWAISYSPHSGEGIGRFAVTEGSYQTEFMLGQTVALTAGTTYSVEYWIRNTTPERGTAFAGLSVTGSAPAAFSVDPYTQTIFPNHESAPTTNTWVKEKFCFTATSSTVHYLLFGGFRETRPGDDILFQVDDISLTVVGAGTASTPVIAMADEVCPGSTITADGSSSLNETDFRWTISASGTPIYQSPLTEGEAGTFNVSTALASVGVTPAAGDCYTLTLTTYNGCETSTTHDFCVQDPSVEFLGDVSTLCAGSPTTLSVSGAADWTYSWSTGDVGLGLNSITVVPSAATTSYSVTVTTDIGCTSTQSIDVTVHNGSNTAPWAHGINNSGESCFYVNVGHPINFTIPTFDSSPEEVVQITSWTGIPGATLTFDNPGDAIANHKKGIFNWISYTPGIYEFDITVSDNNACGALAQTFPFKVVVNCLNCELCVNYENNTPTSGFTLPTETKAGRCITAGLVAPVMPSNDYTLFQAGQFIELGSFFEATEDFEAIIDPGTCVDDCNDCCTNWDGFTYDELQQNYMNFNDGDPATDRWSFTDTEHPFCAYGITGFELYIDSRWQNPTNPKGDIAEIISSSSHCCNYESIGPGNEGAISSISWDGYTTNIWGNQVHPSDGVYYWILKLIGCNGQEEVLSGFFHIGGPTPSIAPISTPDLHSNQVNSKTAPTNDFSIYPNPATNVVKIGGTNYEQPVSIKVINGQGALVFDQDISKTLSFDVSELPAGIYHVNIINGDQVESKILIRQ